jgi:hypothetical protein
MKLSRKSLSLSLNLLALIGLLIAPWRGALAQGRVHRHPAAQRPSVSGELAAAIIELLKVEPYTPAPAQQSEAELLGLVKKEVPPPADDAPLKELLAYWPQHAYNDDKKPADKVRQRFLEAVEERPWLMYNLLDLLPETEEARERLYRLYNETEDEDDQWRSGLREWLKLNTRYFRDELLAAARNAELENGEGFNALEALARLDWEAAKPLLKARQQPFAWNLLYERAMERGELAEAEKYRPQLLALVADRAAGEQRWAALQSLLKSDWPGQAEWFASLFADTTLTGLRPAASKAERTQGGGREPRFIEHDSAENVLAWPLQNQPERLVPRVLKLLGHPDRMVHSAAADALAQYLMQNKPNDKVADEALRSLLPWLDNPRWADSERRIAFVSRFTFKPYQEGFNGLLWILQNDEEEQLRWLAAEALGVLRNPAAAPALRQALNQATEEFAREKLVTALAHCGGLTDEEAAAAIEAYARKLSTPDGPDEIVAANEGGAEKPLPLPVSIGRALHEGRAVEFSEGLTARLFERVKQLRRARPDVASELLKVAQNAATPLSHQFMAQRLGEGWIDLETLQLALGRRDELRKHASGELAQLAQRGGYAAGVAVLLAGDAEAQRAVLKGKDGKAQLALLACARYLREALPLESLAELLADKTLAPAAESYLIAEDSAAARRLVWARHPGEALILGEHFPQPDFVPPRNQYLAQREEQLRQEVLKAEGAEEIYALLHGIEQGQMQSVEIRLRKGQAEMRLFRDPNRWRTRLLTNSELIELQTLAAQPELEEEKTTDNALTQEQPYEYLRLTKAGGRRLFIEGLQRAPRQPDWHERLGDLFYRLSKTGDYQTRFAIEEQLPGVEVHWSDERQRINAACQQGTELRVLLENRNAGPPGFEREPRLFTMQRLLRLNAGANPLEWRLFADKQIGALADEPTACRLSEWMKAGYGSPTTPRVDFFALMTGDQTAAERVWAVPGDREPGIYRTDANGRTEKLVSGNYLLALATPDGKWLVAQKKPEQPRPGVSENIVRLNRQTGQEFPVNMANERFLRPLAYVAEHGKMLLGLGHYLYGGLAQAASAWLLDPATGAVEQVKGEFRPLLEPRWRESQPTGKAGETWAALYDEQKKAAIIGRYNRKTFSFTPQLELPGLRISSADIWVDQAANKVWLVYQGALLRLPLSK